MTETMTERTVRLVIVTDEELRNALRLRAAQLNEDMSEVADTILRDALAAQIAELRRNQEQKGKGRK